MRTMDREQSNDVRNPLGVQGIEFIEYATSKPQALGQVLEKMGFKPIARHRSREVLLYRQGDINIIVNAHEAVQESPVISAVALRVRDAAGSFARVVELGAWPVPTQARVMELNIPAIHGVGTSRIYFVDRTEDFSIYDVDFVPIPGVEQRPAALNDMRIFGVVQYIGNERSEDWIAFYSTLFGFSLLEDSTRFGIMHKGHILRSPCGQFYWQLIEPEPGVIDIHDDECLQRLGLACNDVLALVAQLSRNGIEFLETTHVKIDEHGALTQTYLGNVKFELVKAAA